MTIKRNLCRDIKFYQFKFFIFKTSYSERGTKNVSNTLLPPLAIYKGRNITVINYQVSFKVLHRAVQFSTHKRYLHTTTQIQTHLHTSTYTPKNTHRKTDPPPPPTCTLSYLVVRLWSSCSHAKPVKSNEIIYYRS